MNELLLKKYWTEYDCSSCIKIDFKQQEWLGLNKRLFDSYLGDMAYLDVIAAVYYLSKDFTSFCNGINEVLNQYQQTYN